MDETRSEPSSDDRVSSIAADFARVLWRPVAVFRRHRTTRARRVIFVLALIIAVIFVPAAVVVVYPEARTDAGIGILLIGVLVVAPIVGILIALAVAAIDGVAVWLGARALGTPLQMNRALVIASYGSSVATLFVLVSGLGFLAAGRPHELPPWSGVFSLNLSPLAPESRPVLGLLLGAIGVPAFWIAFLHAVGAREISGVSRPLKYTTPVFWAASVAVVLVLSAIFFPLERWAEKAARSAERAAAEAADTIRAPAAAPSSSDLPAPAPRRDTATSTESRARAGTRP